jgi:hypothetical protein
MYKFTGPSWSTAITDYAPGGLYAGTLSQPSVYDSRGLLTGCTTFQYTLPTSLTLTTGYTTALTDFTAAVVWSHENVADIAASAGLVAPVSGETVLSKSGDLVVSRSGTSTTWDVIVKGTTAASITVPEGKTAMVIVKRSGSDVTVYSSVESGAAATATATEAGAFSTSPLYLASANGSAGLAGTISVYSLHSRALSGDLTTAEVLQLSTAIRTEMAQRGVVLP